MIAASLLALLVAIVASWKLTPCVIDIEGRCAHCRRHVTIFTLAFWAAVCIVLTSCTSDPFSACMKDAARYCAYQTASACVAGGCP